MWIQSKYGHLSVVCASDRSTSVKGKKAVRSVDQDILMVRVRLREHLDRLIEAFDCLSGSKIVETPNNDYRFRILISRSQFTDLMSGLADAVDYGNYKSEVFAREGASPFERALHRVWAIFHDLQTQAYPPNVGSGLGGADARLQATPKTWDEPGQETVWDNGSDPGYDDAAYV